MPQLARRLLAPLHPSVPLRRPQQHPPRLQIRRLRLPRSPRHRKVAPSPRTAGVPPAPTTAIEPTAAKTDGRHITTKSAFKLANIRARETGPGFVAARFSVVSCDHKFPENQKSRTDYDTQ